MSPRDASLTKVPIRWSHLHSTVVPSNVTLSPRSNAPRSIDSKGQSNSQAVSQIISPNLALASRNTESSLAVSLAADRKQHTSAASHRAVSQSARWYESSDRSLPSVSSF